MDGSNEAKPDFRERLHNLKANLNNGTEAAKQLQQNLKFIKNMETVWNHVSITDPVLSANIPLHFSNHREFIRLVELMVEFCKYLDQHKATKNLQNVSGMKTLLQKGEMAFRNNWEMLYELQNTVTELLNQCNTIQSAIKVKSPLLNEEFEPCKSL